MLFSTLNKQKLELAGILPELKGAAIDGVSEENLKKLLKAQKAGCIISKALSVPIIVNASYS